MRYSFKETLKWGIRLICSPFLYLIYIISFLFPRDKKMWVFISRKDKGFADNPKYFFLFVSQNYKDEINTVWLTRNKKIAKALRTEGYRSYCCFSFEGIFLSLRAKYFIFDSCLYGICLWLSGGSEKINLWHGVGIKKIERDIKKGKLSMIYQAKGIRKLIFKILLPQNYLNSKVSYLITTSSLFQKIFSSAFEISKEKVLITGYPRNDVLFSKMKGSKIGTDFAFSSEIRKFKTINEKRKIILYAPTFRDTKEGLFESKVLSFLDDINKFSKDEKILFAIKFHSGILSKKFVRNHRWSNIYFIDPEADVYPVFSTIDILISDYSSISSDFLLLDKPIIFFPYDSKKYITKDREWYFNYEEFMPGLKAYNFKELLKAIKYVLEGHDSYGKEREKIRSLCFKYQDGNSSERIFNMIKNSKTQ